MKSGELKPILTGEKRKASRLQPGYKISFKLGVGKSLGG
jgi:hypothetical protein